MEEEVPRILKAYCYPFPISKSSMFAVGSPTTWPAILGALDWLREVIEVNIGAPLLNEITVETRTGLPRLRENREFERPFFQTGKTQGIS